MYSNFSFIVAMIVCLMLNGVNAAPHAIEALEKTPPAEWRTLWYDKPATQWEQALPLGNGRIGAMVFGGIEQEQLQLNEDTLYAGYPGYRDQNLDITRSLPDVRAMLRDGQYAQADAFVTRHWLGGAQACYQPLGDLYLDFEDVADATGYRRQLDLTTAILTTRYRVGAVTFTREVFITHPDQLLVMRLTADKPGALNVSIRMTSPHPTAVSAVEAEDLLRLSGQAPGVALRRDRKWVEDRNETHKYPALWDADGNRLHEGKTILYGSEADGEGMLFHAAVQADLTGGTLTSQSDVLTIRDADVVELRLAAATSFNGFDKHPVREGRDPVETANRQLAAARGYSYADLRNRHIQDYSRLFKRVALDLGRANPSQPTDTRIALAGKGQDADLLALYFQFGRYLMIAGSRPGSQPLNLQGIWNPHVIPPWASAYTANINLQMNYWPVDVCNLSECFEPLGRLTQELAVDGQRVARQMYGNDGWVAHHNTTIWRCAQPVDYIARTSFWPMSAGWLCGHLYDHYRFTGDRDYLRHQAWPLMKGACEFYLDWLVEDADGRWVTPVSTSPENRFSYTDAAGNKQTSGVCQGATMDLAIIRELFTHTIAASDVLDGDPAFADLLREKTAKLKSEQIGRQGQILEWEREFDEPEPRHRHLSHLYGLHPGNHITPQGTPELAAAAKKTLQLRGDGGTGWSKAWKINFQARLGDGDHAHRMLCDLLAKSTLPNLFDTHPPFQIDGNFGATAGITEMLLQSHTAEVVLLPALPGAWPDGRVRGLRARGGFEADLAWQAGKLVNARILSHAGHPLTLRYGNAWVTKETQPGQALIFDAGLKQTNQNHDELPPIPEQESRQLGFISDIDRFPEQTMDFPIADGPYEPTWASLAQHQAPTWWHDAKFGIFIHWGPQAAGLSGDWYARHLYRQGHTAYKAHLERFGHPSEFGYKDVLHQWDPHEWDPETIVAAYQDAGFRYALIVGVHHDNYDLWDSTYHPWNSVDVGPKKDFLAGWKRALQKAGMRFGVAFHHEYTWWWWQEAFGADRGGDRDGVPYDGRLTLADGRGKWWEGLDPRRLYGIPLDYQPVDEKGKPYAIHDIPFGRKGIFGNHLDYADWYAEQWAMRIIDVVDNYDPDFIYTDGNGQFPFCGFKSGSGYKCDAGARVVAHFYNQDAACGGDADKLAVVKFQDKCPGVATTFEGSYPRGIKTDQPWMGDMAVGDWYYQPGFHYDSGMVVHALLEQCSRGGNLTLCVSLTPEGGIDAGSGQMMKEIGQWMRINGEGIYGSRPWQTHGEGEDGPGRPRTFPGGKMGQKHADFTFSTKDFRFTEGKDGAVYAWCLTVPTPGETVVIRSFGTDSDRVNSHITGISLLGSEETLVWRREADGLYIQYPDSASLAHVVGFKITLVDIKAGDGLTGYQTRKGPEEPC